MARPATSWTDGRFVRAFERLMLPITTANDRLVPDWRAHDVWGPYWATVQDHFRADETFRRILRLVMDAGVAKDSTEAHRRALQDFIDVHVPGYRLVFEADVIPALNQIFEREGSVERVLGFRYGKDGRGAMPDRYYQMLLKNKFMVVGNHHDVLGHFVLFCDPRIRAVTERLVAAFAEALEFEHRLKRRGPPSAELTRQTLHLRRSLRLFTLSWNLAQEKLYVQVESNGRRVVNLIGAFNSVYNTIFSEKLTNEHVRQVAGALGFFNRDPQHSIMMTPSALREYCHRSDAVDSPALTVSLDRYAALWRGLGFDPDTVDGTDLLERFEKIVEASLFRRGRFTTPSIRRRWLDLSDGIMADWQLSKLFERDALVSFADALIDVAQALYRREQPLFAEGQPTG